MILIQQKYNFFNKSQSIVHSHNGGCIIHDDREKFVAAQQWFNSKP